MRADGWLASAAGYLSSQLKIIKAISTANTASALFTQLYGYRPAIWPVTPLMIT